ncbi:aldo/keto reductase [Halalkalibacter lacteus]|uniref:aldo/keto reductase n=1 Tax=Halalkalibacter lacteus TaxID=3090663 RepID=UPI002FC8E1F1
METSNQKSISKLMLGTAQLGQNYGISNMFGKRHKKDALEILRYGISMGINMIDTAPSYGQSEHLIGEFLQQYKTEDINLPSIVTKIPRVMLQEHSMPDEIYMYVKNSLQSSMSKLKVQSIDVVLLHDPEDMITFNGEIVKSLLLLKEQGFVKKIGVSVYQPEEVRRFLSAGCFDVIQVPINVFDHRLITSGLLNELKNRKIEVYARSVYLQGLLFLNINQLPNQLEVAKEPLKKLYGLATATNLNPAKLSMLFVRDLPEIDRIVIGCDTKTQLEDNINLITSPKLEEDIVKEIYHLFNSMPEKIINPSLWK